MVNWNSPVEIAHDAEAFSSLMHALFGLYIWEFVNSLDFDWAVITGRIMFRWPFIIYLVNRYLMLVVMTMLLVTLDNTNYINCDALYAFNASAGALISGFATLTLSVRTMAIWGNSRYIVVPLTILSLGHWAILVRPVTFSATWVPGENCVITNTINHTGPYMYVYTMVLDFIVLVLAAWRLTVLSRQTKSRLVQVLLTDGVIYFAVAFLVNLMALIFEIYNLNGIMDVIANPAAAICSTVVAGRLVRRLDAYAEKALSTEPTDGSTTRSGRFPTRTANLTSPTRFGGRYTVELDMNGNMLL